MGYDPASLVPDLYSCDRSYLVVYWPKYYDEVDGQIMVRVSGADGSVMKVARSSEFYVKDTSLTQEERQLILGAAEKAVQETRVSNRSYRQRILADDSSYAVYYIPHPNPQVNAKGEEVGICGGWIKVIVLKRDYSVAGVQFLE